MSIIKDFSGGKHVRLHPQLIQSNQSTEYTNCDNEAGILKPTKSFTPSGIQADTRWTYFRYCDRIVSSSYEAYWAELDNYLYEAIPSSGITKEDCAGNKTNLGIAAPTGTPVGALSGSGNLCGVYKYVYTYYNATEGIESAPTELSNEIDIATITSGGSTTDPLLEEKQEFLLLGSKFTTIRNSTMSDEEKIEAMKCAVDHAGPFTITRFINYVAAQQAVYNSGANVIDTYNQLTCNFDNTPEAHDINKSYYNIVVRVSGVLENTAYNNSQKIDVINCILGGHLAADDYYGNYIDIVADMIAVTNSTIPPGALVTSTDWYLTQYKCLTFDLPGVAEQDTTTTSTCSGKILVSNISASSDTQVTDIRLYRIGGSLTHYSQVTTLPNTNQSYLDNNSDASIAGNHVLDSFANGTPPTNPKYLTEGNAMLFVSSGNKLYFSEVARPYAWPATNFLDFGQEITGIGLVQNGLLVFTRYRTFIVTGNNPSTLSRYLISGEQGCVNHDTIAFSDNRLFWLSTDGICTSSGGNVEIVTQGLLGRFNPTTSINADVFDKMYILGYDDKTIILDNRYGYIVRELDYNGWVGDFKDELYMQMDNELKLMFSGPNDSMTYKSPIYTEGRLSEYKSFKDVYITFKGNIKVDVLLHSHDGQYAYNVYSKTLNAVHMQNDLKLKGNREGYGISFEITGTGEVHEIDFKAAGRENGK